MSKGFIFFCCACAILLFTIINLSVGPIVSGTMIKLGADLGTVNCQEARDIYNDDPLTGDAKKYGTEWALHACERSKGMHNMEYTSFIFNMVIGFICGLLGLLHLFDVKKEFVSKTGMIGLICGIIGFIFSFVYVILNGLVFTTYDTNKVKRNSDGVYAEQVDSTHYKCIYFDSYYNYHSRLAKFSDFIGRQYNYDKDIYKNVPENCIDSSFTYYDKCRKPLQGETFTLDASSSITNACKYIYAKKETQIIGKDLFNRFLTTLLLSLFNCLANLGLALFGFLLFRTPGEF